MIEESFLDIARCKNCKNLILKEAKYYCKDKDREISLSDTCSIFDKSVEIQIAEDLIKDPDIFKIITEKELNKAIEGELKSRMAIFLSLCSIWVENSEIPLNTLVSSESSAGKSYICKKIIKVFPKELVQYRTKITPEAFTYWHYKDSIWNWTGKICYLEDISQTLLDSTTFKVMCSEGSISTVVIKQKAVDIEIKGKPIILITTARTNPQSEILNRFQIISLDESNEQTERIIFREAENAIAGNYEDYNENITLALGMLKRRKVNIPYSKKIAQFLKENYNFDYLRLRRDFSRLLDLIRCSAVLHQYQRKEENGVIFADGQDYEIARECINYIQAQTFRGLTHRLKKAFDCCIKLKEFTAKEIHTKFPFVNQKMWYIYLDQLLERHMIYAELRKLEDVKQKVTFYHMNENRTFELPEFLNLPENTTKVINDTKVTKVIMVTNDGEQL